MILSTLKQNKMVYMILLSEIFSKKLMMTSSFLASYHLS